MSEFRTVLRFMMKPCSQITKTSGLLIISLVFAPISACSSTTPEATSVQTSPTTVSSPVAAESPIIAQAVKPTVTIPGVSNAKDIIFKTPPKGANIGFFEGVNDSGKLSHTLPKTKAFQVLGWAVSGDGKRPADYVIITVGQANTPVALASVKISRPDVGKVLKNPALAKAGWITSVAPSSLSGQKATLKAWTYDPQTKTAVLLGKIHEIVLQ